MGKAQTASASQATSPNGAGILKACTGCQPWCLGQSDSFEDSGGTLSHFSAKGTVEQVHCLDKHVLIPQAGNRARWGDGTRSRVSVPRWYKEERV